MRVLLRTLLLIAVAGLPSGCLLYGPTTGVSFEEVRSMLEAREPLFKGDQAVLDSEEIDRILASRIVVPPKGKIAVLGVEPRRGSTVRPGALAEPDHDTVADLVVRLRSSKRVSAVAVLPSMLAPAGLTVPYLQEAAARVKADWILVYRGVVSSRRGDRSSGRDTASAHARVEAVLVDTRTGLLPFTAASNEKVSLRKRPADRDLSETSETAEQQAVAMALAKIAEDLVRFLDGIL